MIKNKKYSKKEYLEVKDRLKEGKSAQDISMELELPLKDIEDIYKEWKKALMEAINEGDSVQYVLDIKGYKKKIAEGLIYKKLDNSVIVDSKEDDYINKNLNGRVVVSVKDVLIV